MHNTTSFLEEVAHDLCRQGQSDLTNCLVILPTLQSAEAFRLLLLNQPCDFQQLPHIITLESWVIQHSRIQIAPTLHLATLLYEYLQKLHANKETFEQFYSWGCILLGDFDIIDKCLVSAEQLFANLYEQKLLAPTYEQLSVIQKEAIQSFWNTFGTRLSTQQKDFLQFWKSLSQLYFPFTQHLISQKKGYLGLCYRILCNNLNNELLISYRQVALVGFNALHPAEEKIFAWLHAHLPTRFYWDVDAYYMEDEQQEAGFYLRTHQQKPYFQASLKPPYPARIQDISKKIKLFECDTEVAQAQLVGEQIQQLLQVGGGALKSYQIAIVLANEELLVPLLRALPADFKSIYSSLGPPLTHTSIYQLVEQLFAFQLAISQADFSAGHFPTSEVIQLLQQSTLRAYDPAIAAQTIQIIAQDYPQEIPQQVLTSTIVLYQLIFRPVSAGITLLEYIQTILCAIADKHVNSTSPQEILEKRANTLLQEQLTQLQQYHQLFSDLSIDRWGKFFRQFIQSLRITRETSVAAASISIVRIWETANIDFEQVFIVGMNEGDLPAKNEQGSFIPYNLRRGYGLPTKDTFQASLDAYYFYRLLQRANQVQITYSAARSSKKQEISRYLLQLIYESKLSIEKYVLTSNIYSPTIKPIIVNKDKSVVENLKHFLVKPGKVTRALSPAALNTYLDCSLRFYFKYILNLPITQHLTSVGEAMQFGTLVHEVLEKIYTTFQASGQNREIQRLDIALLRKQLPSVIAAIVVADKGNYLQGGHSIIEQEVVQKVVDKILALDEVYTPFELIGVELGRYEPLSTHFKLPEEREIVFRGIIDRVDRKQEVVRVIDYKTGNDSTYTESISSLFDRNSSRNRAFFQTFLYAWLLQRQGAYKLDQVVPILMNTRAIFQPNFDPRLKLSSKHQDLAPDAQKITNDYVYIDNIMPYQREFEAGLKILLTELLDPGVPFSQTDNLQMCTQCPYNRICQRA